MINPYFQNYSNSQQQNVGLVSVRNEIEARNYPVAFGNSVTFKDENAPYIYTKTMGFSQMDTPTFEKYRLIKEDANLPHTEAIMPQTNTLSAEEIDERFAVIWKEITALKKGVEDADTK